MAFHTLVLEDKALDVAMSESGNRLAVLSGSGLAVYTLDLTKRPIPKPLLLWRSDAIKTHCPRQIAFIGDEQLFCLTDNWDEDEGYLWRSEGEAMVPRGPIMDAGGVTSLAPDVTYNTLFVQFQSGALHRVENVETLTDLPPQTAPVHKFPSFTPEIKIVTIDGQVC